MGKYRITTGQNIFDVALHIYGSIEGIVDLMMNNTSLSLTDTLKAGDCLTYTDGYIINADIVSYYRMHGIIPANGERCVYPKPSAFPKVFSIRLNNKKTSAGFRISGNGKMEIDWGDNSPLQTLTLGKEEQTLQHSFDNAIAGYRKITLYGDFTIKQADFTLLDANTVMMFRSVEAEKFILNNTKADIGFTALLKGLYDINLTGVKTASFLPLLENKTLRRIDLSQINAGQEVLDNYLIALVKQYYGRSSCTLTLTRYPSGEYREPEKDENGNYILSCGMEAVWVLCNEPAWNEGGYWKFCINEEIYTTEP